VSWFLTEQYHHLRTPNSQGCGLVDSSGQFSGGGNFGVGVSAGSPHPGGAFVGFCDGSVKFVSDEIAIEVWRAQGTRSGGEAF
jgi:prepilin-type processing-associated H-X9-DG protein